MLARPASTIMQIELTNEPPQSAALVRDGEPPAAKLSETVFAWAWAINVEPGSLFSIRMVDPEGKVILDVKTKPLVARKADYVVYAGGKHAKNPGTHLLQIDLLSSGKTMGSMARSIEIG